MDMLFKLFLYFVLWLIMLTAVFEAYARLLRCLACLSRPLPMLLARLLGCVIGGVLFVLPCWGLEFFLGWAFTASTTGLIVEELFVMASVYACPLLAYWFFQRGHMASLKELGYFLPMKRP